MSVDQFYSIMLYVMTGIVGLCVGSFLNVVIYRVPENMSLANPPSHCPNCNYKLHWYDNIPVLSYIILGGKCRKCRQRISPRYMAVEIANAVLWLLCLYRFEDMSIIYAAIAAVACSVSICIFFIDLEHMIIFDRFQIIFAVLALAAVFLDKNTKWYSHIIAAVAGGTLLILVAVVFHKIYGMEALGGGDIKLVIVTGLFLGWQKLLLEVLIGSVSGAILFIIWRRRGEEGEEKEHPFAPFLTAGFVIAMLFGDSVINAYMDILLG